MDIHAQQQPHLEPGNERPCKNERRSLYNRLCEISSAFVPLAYTTFGGPQAHIALLIVEFVERRAWLPSNIFAELFAIAQSLPGPASTQLAYSIALVRGGALAGLLAFALWSLPGMLIMTGFAVGVSHIGSSLPQWALHLQNGLTAAAIGLVALAGYKLSVKLLADPVSAALGALSAVLAINLHTLPWLFPVLMIVGGFVSWAEAFIINTINTSRRRSKALLNASPGFSESTATEIVETDSPKTDREISSPSTIDKSENDFQVGFSYSTTTGIGLLVVWLILLITSIVIRSTLSSSRPLSLFGTMYFVGSIIFGGGPVVIPLLQNYVVEHGWLTDSEFLIGLAIINAMPGPNFNLAAYIGVLALRNSGIGLSLLGSVIANVGIFAPGILLMSGLMPLWNRYRALQTVQSIFKGINAAAVGLVFAAIYLLERKAVAPISQNITLSVEPLANYPIYIGVAVFSYTASGFLNLPTPFAIMIGGLIGICVWLADGRP